MESPFRSLEQAKVNPWPWSDDDHGKSTISVCEEVDYLVD
jgi:hypothetical protein